ncbi:SDR family oxidoreductase [Dongia sp.]|uniref:SDR family oxidoreductase n=1 Tax=Dongia sp. TaxID=1977262 RepID=UPI0037518410
MPKPRTVLITGAASGIGKATALLMASQGWSVAAADIDKAGAEAVAKKCGDAAFAVTLDIRSEPQWRRALDRAWKRFGRLDVLINNAAVVHTGYARDIPLARHADTMNTNFIGPLTGMMTALPRFKQQGYGHLVTIASMTSFIPFPGLSTYAAAKHALRAFHLALAFEERNAGLDFAIVYPGATETPMLEQEARDDASKMAFAGNAVGPEVIAGVILEAIAKKKMEAYYPPERGKVVRRLGVNVKALREMVERNEAIGAEKLRARRAGTGKSHSRST